MYLGKLMELSPAEELYDKPIHPYTSALLERDPDSRSEGEPGPHAHGRHRASRPTRSARRAAVASTPAARGRARSAGPVEPQLTEYAGGHLAACHHPQNVTAEEISRATRSDASPLSAGTDVPDLWRANGDASASQAPAATQDAQ